MGKQLHMTDRVVVTGIGLVTPLGSDRETTWKNLINGESGIDYIGAFDAEGFESRIAGEVTDFTPEAILGRRQAKRMDRFAQFACVASLEALEHAGIDMEDETAERVAVLIGSGVGGIITISEQIEVLNDRGPRRVNPFLIPMMLGDMASGQVSMTIGAKGPNFSVVSACATGTDSIGEAAEMIRRGVVDVAIAGGSEAAICPIGVSGFNACKALSTRNDDPQGASRPFDAERDGFVLGEGAGVIVIESLKHAEKRGAEVLCELVGYGATSDAHHVTQPHPEGEGAAEAMKIAIEQAGIDREEVAYINAHGTSTPLNDKFETIAVKKAFGDHADKLSVSSTKSMTGHLLGAAGGIEAGFSVLAISESAVPPTINLENPDIDCDLDYVPNMAKRGRVPVVMSNSLGFGGHNASVLFKEFDS
ncbi:MAG: beta-ketoacyl-ACP synthase II [Chloroflexi bacterium]|nr:beta-ketoacyl-ACP synthase II [Chloroflexota bacterium]